MKQNFHIKIFTLVLNKNIYFEWEIQAQSFIITLLDFIFSDEWFEIFWNLALKYWASRVEMIHHGVKNHVLL